MTYSPLLLVHIGAGLVGVLSGFLSMFARKGSRLHKKSGNVFVMAMLFMAAGGAIIALMKSQPGNVIAGTFTCYLVSSAWLTVRRPAGTTGRMEQALLTLALVTGAGSLILGLTTANRGMAPMYFVFGIVTLLCSAGDLRILLRGGVRGAARLLRHLWRMGMALFIATGSFFLGTAGDPIMRKNGLRATLFTPTIRQTHLPAVPVFLVAAMTIFWLFYVKFSKRHRSPETRYWAAGGALLAGETTSTQAGRGSGREGKSTMAGRPLQS